MDSPSNEQMPPYNSTKAHEERWPTVRFSPIELSLLNYLGQQNGEIASRRDILTEVWGYHPDSNTRTVQTTVQRIRVKIEQDPRHPVHLLTVRNRGYRLVLPASESQRAVQPTRVEDLQCLGRSAELAAVRAALHRGHRLVTLHGPPGIGKTQVAARVAEDLCSSRDSWFVDLSGAETAPEVLTVLAATLDIRPSDRPLDLRIAVHDALCTVPNRLLFLDNLEQLNAPGIAEVTSLAMLPDGPQVVATSRQRLSVAREQIVAVGPLAPHDAVRLMTTRIAAIVGEDTPDDDIDMLYTIAGLLEYVPLALEMAAATARILTIAELHNRLTSGTHLLRLNRRDVPVRQQTLESAIAWSWRGLTEREQQVLRQLCVFRGGCTIGIAEEVLGSDALDNIGSLLDKSMLRRKRSALGARLDVGRSVREFVKSHPCGEDAALRRRHATWALRWSAQWNALSDRHAVAMDTMVAEVDNLLDAYAWLLAHHPEQAASLLCSLLIMYRRRSVPVRFTHRVSDCLATPGNEANAQLHYTLAASLKFDGHLHEAQEAIEDGLRTMNSTLPVHGHLLEIRAAAHRSLGRLADALADATRAVKLGEQHDWPRQAGRLNGLGMAYAQLGDSKRATQAYRRGIELADRQGTRVVAGALWSNLAGCLASTGDYLQQMDCLRRAKDIADEFNDQGLLYSANVNLAVACLRSGEYQEANARFQQLIQPDQRFSGRTVFGVTTLNGGVAALAVGDVSTAITLLSETLSELDRVGAVGALPLVCKAYLAIGYVIAGNLVGALELRDDLHTTGIRLGEDHEQVVTVSRHLIDGLKLSHSQPSSIAAGEQRATLDLHSRNLTALTTTLVHAAKHRIRAASSR